ncbi:antitermination protein [Pantoea sp. LMR881]|uniref:antitermination protein Q n=1 Tax=Pantoea sp. LMR881 TaxID=3014336 RepID=UPI0022B06E52|nr:antitermination protein [Pantoea sp. LMR881]MCZ4057807.1 antitermination protein [Pantoea sp. LMR881]MCZ4058051.1 antitermination protein [Pantoea sp. LMR881]
MSLEATAKYHYAKTQNFSGMAPQTSPDALTGTDYIAAMGMTMSRAVMGYCAFMGKIGISENDAARAVSLLTEYALQTCDKVAALRKLDTDIKPAVMQTLATYAYMDYCRSAASKKPCDCCHATGFIDADVFTTKSTMVRLPEWARDATPTKTMERQREVKEVVRVLCPECKGKCVVSTACRDCNGRGRAVLRKETQNQGVPVMGDCKQCGGRGFERIPSTEAYRAITSMTDVISLATWEKSGKAFYEQLIGKLEIEESWANAALNKVTA